MSLAMSIAQREQFLSDVRVGIVSISRAERGPLTVPIWYDYEPGGDVWMITNLGSMKGKLLEQTSRISLCAQTETAPYSYVSVEGPFSLTPTPADKLLQMATRYLGEEMGKAYAAGSGDSEGDSVIVTLTPEHWLTVDYSKR